MVFVEYDEFGQPFEKLEQSWKPRPIPLFSKYKHTPAKKLTFLIFSVYKFSTSSKE